MDSRKRFNNLDNEILGGRENTSMTKTMMTHSKNNGTRPGTTESVPDSFVDDSHPAATKLFDDAVMRDGLANHCGETTLGEGC
jgi:hypothetical protein